MIKSKIKPGILFLLFGIHLTLPLTLGNTVIVPEILVSTFLLVTGYLFRAILNKQLILLLSGIFLLSMLSMLLSPDWSDYFRAHLRSSLNLVFSLLIALAVVIYLLHRDRPIALSFNVKVFLLVALTVSVLEVTSPLITYMVDSFRFAVFPVERIYTADWRDIELFGFRRPTFLGNEPSYLGITLAVFAVCLSIAQSTLRAQIAATALLIAGMLVVRSPTALSIALIIPIVFLSDIVRGKLRVWQWLVLLELPVLVLLFSVFVFDVFGTRIEQVLSGEDNSTDLRLVKPAVAARLSVSRSPLVGMGVGGRDKLTEEMLAVADWSRHTDYVLGRDRISDFFATGTFLIVVDTGVLSVMMLLVIFLAFRSVLKRITFLEFIVCFVLISITMGGWTHPRLWLLMGVVLLFLHQRRTNWADIRRASDPSERHSTRHQWAPS
jgi:hypothetical protein